MSQHTTSTPSDGSMSPMLWYQNISSSPGFIFDAAQESAIIELEALWHELIDFKARRNQFLGRSLLSPDIPRGLYLWGGVGRGKSFLMDMFYACVPYKRKRRIHFHNFMSEVHHELKALSAHKDPLLALADKIEKSIRLLCFDEFHVSDIADAMILGRLMEAMFERGVVMIITSNSAPDELYANGLQRQKFIPAINLIKRNLKIINIDSGNDYRLRVMPSSPLFMLADDSESYGHMLSIFNRLSAGTIQNTPYITIQGRPIPVKMLSAKVVWFEFSEICGGLHAQQDYLEIAQKYAVLLISNIPQLNANKAAEAQRLIWLVDILYDNKVKLVATAAATPDKICTDKEKLLEFARTASRLVEMQSQSYLELPHHTENYKLT
jgi:cell division protein ZapE